MAKTLKSRVLKIRNFKNIGVSLKDNEYQEIYLNGYWNDKIIGNLIILIGENNVGKTNILNAINVISRIDKEKEIKLSFILKATKPNNIEYSSSSNEIKLVYKENDKEKYFYGISLENDMFSIINKLPKTNIYMDETDDEAVIVIIKKDIEELLNKFIPLSKELPEDEEESKRFVSYFNKLQTKINEINDYSKLNGLYDKLKKTIQRFISHYNKRNSNKILLEENFIAMKGIEERIDFNKTYKIKDDIKKVLDKYISLSKKLPSNNEESIKFLNYFNKLQTKINEIDDYERLNKLYNKLKKTIKIFILYYNKRNDNKIEDKFIDKEGVEQIELNHKNEIVTTEIPIIKYDNGHMHMYKDNNLQILISEINKENFFTYLLKPMENGIENIKKAYSNTINSKDIYEDLINEFLKENFTKKFNKLSSKVFDKHEYDFIIKFEGTRIRLLIKRDKEATTLSQQSAGFKWFFGLFFRLYFIYDLYIGDIVLIDEPELHLSIPSIRELRNILKEIAKEKGITFITTTHSPFFVDIDYLDEIKIVKKKKEGYGVEIVNFGDIDTHKEADTLKEIIDAFGLGNLNRDIITNPNNKVIFVEGITDYNYLIAFKKLYEYKNNGENLNLSFLPIAGLGKMHENHNEELENKIKLLSKLNNVVVLTDGDETANKFKELSLSEEKLNVIKLTDIDNNFEEIESLFSESDKENFESIIKNKSLEASSLFKNIILDLDKELEEETINNFNKVLLYLKNEKTL